MPQDPTDDKSTLVHVMAWCHQATSHYLNQCWPRSPMPYGVTRPQWVNHSEFLMLEPVYSRQIKSIPWLPMTWIHASPGHQQPWHWLCALEVNLNNLQHLSVEILMCNLRTHIHTHMYMSALFWLNLVWHQETYLKNFKSKSELTSYVFQGTVQTWVMYDRLTWKRREKKI